MKVQQIAKKALPVVVAVAAGAVLAGFVFLTPSQEPVASAACPPLARCGEPTWFDNPTSSPTAILNGEATDPPPRESDASGSGRLMADGLGYVPDRGSHLVYANDGSGEWWTAAAGSTAPCPECGWSRSSNAWKGLETGPEHALDQFTIAYTPTGLRQGESSVVGTESGAWPLATSQLVTKVIKAGSGPHINGFATIATVGVVAIDAESGLQLGRFQFETGENADVPGDAADAATFDIELSDHDQWMLEQALDGQQEGASVLAAWPGEGSDRAIVLNLYVATVVPVPECSPNFPMWGLMDCVTSGSGGATATLIPAPKKVGDVTVIGTGGQVTVVEGKIFNPGSGE